MATYGLTLEAYDAMLAEQGGRCGICQELADGRRFDVDHDHATGAVRGLLCNNCNVGIGRFRDDALTLRRAVAYVEAHEQTNREEPCRAIPAA